MPDSHVSRIASSEPGPVERVQILILQDASCFHRQSDLCAQIVVLGLARGFGHLLVLAPSPSLVHAGASLNIESKIAGLLDHRADLAVHIRDLAAQTVEVPAGN